MAKPVRFGIFVPQGWKMDLVQIADPIEKFEAMTNVAKAADQSNFDSIWVYDHFHTVPTPEIESTFECWTITATLARDTSRVKIGQMTGCNGFRNPALYAKIASTVDVASHGRLFAGIGAGWYEHEWRAYGYQWDEIPVRMAKFREGVEIIYRMWTEERPVYQGTYWSIDKPINEPKGVRKPHPSFWIAGGGEKVTLKLAAKYGDACNIGRDIDTIRRKLDVLRGHCETLGRDYDDIIRSTEIDVVMTEPGADLERSTEKLRGSIPFSDYAKGKAIGPPDVIRAHIQERIDAGIDYFIIYIPGVAYDHEHLHRFSQEIIPSFT